MWNMKFFVIGATEIMTKNLNKVTVDITRKAFSRLSTQTAAPGTPHLIRKVTATVWNLKPEWWGVPLVQEEKYQGKGNLW
jgi:hypothetical protein